MEFTKQMTLLGAALLAVLVASASQAHAVEGCKVKVDPKTGAIQVSARAIGGFLRWGNSAAFPNNVFANAATCIAGDKAKKCEFGAPGSAEQITPPELCTVFLRDSAGPDCSAFIKGCTPGVRPGGAVAGVAKAGVVAFCTSTAAQVVIRRSFNNVNGGAITIDDGLLPGRCEITFPFSLENRFFSVEPVNFISTVTTFKLDYEVNGSTLSILTQQYSPPVWTGVGMDVSVLIF